MHLLPMTHPPRRVKELTRREALRIGTLTFAGLFTNACQGKGEGDKPPAEEEKKTAQVSRTAVLFTADVPCNTRLELWTGPNDSVVFVEWKSGEQCGSQLVLIDKQTNQVDLVGNAVPAGKEFSTSVAVPDTKQMVFMCIGMQNADKCTVKITKVEPPPLPANTVLGTAQVIQAPAPIRNPTAAPPIGTPIRLDCSKDVELWSGKPSYVTVSYKGTDKCLARIEAERNGAAVKTNSTDAAYCETFGPVTKLTGYCDGSVTGTCEFQVTQTIELP
jgi:hypothetical protein